MALPRMGQGLRTGQPRVGWGPHTGQPAWDGAHVRANPAHSETKGAPSADAAPQQAAYDLYDADQAF